MQETRIQPLVWEDALEEEMATHSSILPGKSRGQRSLAGYSSLHHKELDMTEHTHENLFTELKVQTKFETCLYIHLKITTFSKIKELMRRAVLFTFCNSLHLWLLRSISSWILTPNSAFSLLLYFVSVEVFEENPASRRYAFGKKEECFNSFFRC